GWIEKFLTSKDLNHKYLAIAACSVRRENPGEALTRILKRDDCKQHAKLYCRSLRLIGELRRQDLMPAINEAITGDDEEVEFWSNWSAILLGKRDAVSRLKSYVFRTGVHQQKAIHIAFRSLPVDQGRQWIAELGQDSEQARAVIIATGVLGDPHAVNWLISKMEQAEVSKLAAESFSYITGIDLLRNELTSETPPKLASQPNDDPDDDNIKLDEDENLPWPDIDKVKSIWVNHGRNFIAGKRYFMGREITTEFLKDKLINGYQRQRHAATMELALIDSNMPLQNTRARVAF
ncbi:MAG: TIGR02270 family protein, partial [Gammaproteobacteria bacterium]|nr:TIGR02270 family protein [Gammaproteobacteria bacterium]